jgi:SPP1 gp7 family putative phage head morphogenesis protein
MDAHRGTESSYRQKASTRDPRARLKKKVDGLGSPDNLASRGVDEALGPLQVWRLALLEVVDEAESLEVAREKIWDTLTSDVSELIGAIADETLLGDLLGRLEVETKDKGKALADFVDLPPKEAIAYFRRKRIMSPEAFKRLASRYKRQAFAVAGLTEQYALEFVHGSIGDALETGASQRAVVKEIRKQLNNIGITNTSRHHLNLVFRNQVQGAYAAGRWSQLQAVKKTRPYWQYFTAGDKRVRESHAAMHGKIFAANDPIWGQWYPPNGHNCRCTVVSLSKAEISRDGQKVESAGSVADAPDPGWTGSPQTIKSGDRAAKQVARAARELKVLRPPRVGNKGASAYSDPGGLARTSIEKAADIDRWANYQSTKLSQSLSRGGSRPRRLPRRAAEVQIPIPSVHADAAEQLVRRIAGEPGLADALTSLKISARYAYSKAAGSLSSAVVESGGIARRSELLLSLVGRTPAQIEGLARVALSAEAGTPGALRRAAAVADIVIRGEATKLPGYRAAVLNWRSVKGGFEYRLTKRPLRGFSSQEVLVSEKRYRELS